jgi:4-carboxymuconolactone decarboxylase
MTSEMPQRLPLLPPDTLSPDQRQVYEAVIGGPRAEQSPFGVADVQGRLMGPYNAMLYSPEIGMCLQELGVAIRFRTRFTPREREIAILMVAAYHRSDYVWYAHERVGHEVGLNESDMEALRMGDKPALTDAREGAVYDAVHNLTEAADMNDSEYDTAVSSLSHSGLIELTALVGYYMTLALQLSVLRVSVPEGETAPIWR